MISKKRRQTAAGSIKDAPVPDEQLSQFLSKLADALHSRGHINIQDATIVEQALAHAITLLPDGDLKYSIETHLDYSTKELFNNLSQLQDGADKNQPQSKAKKQRSAAAAAAHKDTLPRSRPSAATHQARVKHTHSDALPTTFLDASLRDTLLDSNSNRRRTSLSIKEVSLMVSRVPLCLSPLLPSLPTDKLHARDICDAVRSVRAALRICCALSGHVITADDVLCLFYPIIEHMYNLRSIMHAEAFDDDSQHTHTVEMSAAKTSPDDARELFVDVVSRIFIGVESSMKGIEERCSRKGEDLERRSAWWLAWNTTPPGPEREEKRESAVYGKDGIEGEGEILGHWNRGRAFQACCMLVSLRTYIALVSSTRQRTHQSIESITLPRVGDAVARTVHDMQRFPQHAVAGILTHIADMAEDVLLEGGESDRAVDALVLLCLHRALTRQANDDIHPGYYFARLLSARTACKVAEDALHQPTLAAEIQQEASTVVPPPFALPWLERQPPSSSITAAISSAARGQSGLSEFFMSKNVPEKALKMLTRAAIRGVLVGSDSDGAGVGDDDGEEGALDMLFVENRVGDVTVFQGWSSEEEDNDGDGDDNNDSERGLKLDELPDGDRENAEEDGYSSEY